MHENMLMRCYFCVCTASDGPMKQTSTPVATNDKETVDQVSSDNFVVFNDLILHHLIPISCIAVDYIAAAIIGRPRRYHGNRWNSGISRWS